MITANIGLPALGLTTSDTALINLSGSTLREGVQNAVVTNTTGSPITVSLYESPDATSASGLLIWSESVPANDDAIITGVVGQGFEQGQNLIATASAVGVNIKLTVTRTIT